jgi:hypothetical protein
MSFKKIFTRNNILYFLFITVFLIVCLEIFGRIYLTTVLKKSVKPKFQFDSYRIYAHIPNFKEGDGKRDWIVINGQGFRRTTEVLKEKPANTIRIFLMGGSAAHGISSAPPYPLRHIYPNETIDSWLENLLKTKYKDKNVEVINAAVTGYMVYQHTPYILGELLDYHPDIFVFFDGANDHYFNNVNYQYYDNNVYQFWKGKLQNASFVGMFDYFMLWLSEYSGFARGYVSWSLIQDAKKNADIAHPKCKFKDEKELIEGHKKIAPKQYLRAMETNLSILRNHDVDAVICLQPMLVLRDSSLYSKEEKSFYTPEPHVKLLYPYVKQEVKGLTSKYNTPFLDINESFNDVKHKEKQLLIDYCHLSAEGGKVTADAIFPVLDSLVNKRINQIKN